MKREWIEQGLRVMREREEQLRLASERRLHHAAVIKERGPDLMRRLVTDVAAAIDEYRHGAPASGSDEIEFEELPSDGFYVAKARFPKVGLECRPGYETQAVHCNMTRTDDHESAPQEFLFNLGIKVDDSDEIALEHETRTFQTLDEVVEFLLRPVLFPAPGNQDP